ncbi:hypothetical protein K466DRAFT_589555 [Polyporus arcularius HHB13444]|uniref:Uncharacterized protein n=1 Tax=Polyporus arcularius HHB13444 TaxID=1314778 RepID=A0A5C3P1Y7_9APHY|nr:hypothetical protein K466DRAFT_589555 [Polyporus arcularius HHB13444]
MYAISIVLAACLFAGTCSSAAVRSRREVTAEAAPNLTVSHSSGTTFAVAVRPANDQTDGSSGGTVSFCETSTTVGVCQIPSTITYNKCYSLKGQVFDNNISSFSTGACTNCKIYDDYSCKTQIAEITPDSTVTGWTAPISSYKCFQQCP